MPSDALLVPNVGDVLSRLKFPFVHKGVYLGNDIVIHNTPERGEHISSLSDFAECQLLSVTPIQEANRHFALREAAATLAAPRPYDAIANNCEHTVTRIIEGREYSRQLQWVGLLLILGLLAIAVKR